MSAKPRARPRLLAVDLDGTLLDPRGAPHERDVVALKALQSEGIVVTIVTGRLYSGTRPTAEALGLRGPVACVDGSHVVDVRDHTTLVHRGIRGPHALALRDALGASGAATFVFARDVIVHDDSGSAFAAYVSTWSMQVEVTEDVARHGFWTNEDGITAVVAVGTSEQIDAAVERMKGTLAGAIEVAFFPIRRLKDSWGLIARAAGGSKGAALRWIAEHHGCEVHETVCVGDWLNDVSMFRVAGRSFAMGQAPEEVRRHATDVLPETVEQGGGIARVVAEVFGVRVD